MYIPSEADKSYLTLLKEKGVSAALQSAVMVVVMYFFNQYIGQQQMPIAQLLITYFLFCAFYTWKPKCIRWLRGKLRGKEFRNKSD